MAINKKSKKLKVAVALSGGVDSAVAAALLKEQGYEVVGIFMKFWRAPFDNGQSGGWNRCCTFEAQQRARAVARALDIDFYVLNLERDFKKRVVDYFFNELKAGRTPNPCVICNKEIKFGLLFEKAKALDCDYLATGHYARKCEIKNQISPKESELPTGQAKIKNANQKSKIYKLLRAKCEEKDQSYFLWQLNQKQLARTLFPIGEIASKAEVRKLAKKYKLPVAETKDSQEVCFIKDKAEYFIKKFLGSKRGKIINQNGEVLGEHQGLWFYTIGQRKGLPLSQGPWFVVAKDFKKNTLVVSQSEKDLFKKELIAENVNWFSGVEPTLPIKVKAQIRYRHAPVLTTIYKLPTTHPEGVACRQPYGAGYKLILAKPQRAITPGQSVVFYSPRRSSSGAKAGEGDELLGGGIIK